MLFPSFLLALFMYAPAIFLPKIARSFMLLLSQRFWKLCVRDPRPKNTRKYQFINTVQCKRLSHRVTIGLQARCGKTAAAGVRSDLPVQNFSFVFSKDFLSWKSIFAHFLHCCARNTANKIQKKAKVSPGLPDFTNNNQRMRNSKERSRQLGTNPSEMLVIGDSYWHQGFYLSEM